jgi:hypothetical protein
MDGFQWWWPHVVDILMAWRSSSSRHVLNFKSIHEDEQANPKPASPRSGPVTIIPIAAATGLGSSRVHHE